MEPHENFRPLVWADLIDIVPLELVQCEHGHIRLYIEVLPGLFRRIYSNCEEMN